MTLPTITALPTPPSSADPTNFDTRADTFLAALPDLATEVNAVSAAMQAEVNYLAATSPLMRRNYGGSSSDFYGTASPWGEFVGSAVTSGTVAANVDASTTNFAEHPGMVRLSAAAGANSGYALILGSTGSTANVRMRAGMVAEFVVKLVANTSGFVARLGWMDSFASTAPTDGLYVEVLGGSTTKVQAYSNTVNTSSSSAENAGTSWRCYRLEIDSDGATATLTCYDDSGAIQGSQVTLAVPAGLLTSGRELGFGVLAYYTTGGATGVLDVDWAGCSYTAPLTRGTSTGGAAAGLASVVSGARRVAAPNATVPAHSVTPIASESNVDLVLAPKGTGAVLAQVPDNTATGGNKRGTNAVDLQTTRGANTQVASGVAAAIGGGRDNVASGDYSHVPGGRGASTLGLQATEAWAGNNASGTPGIGQVRRMILRGERNGNGTVRLTADGAAASASNVPVVQAESAMHARVTIVCKSQATDSEAKSTTFATVLYKGTSAGSSAQLGGAPSQTHVGSLGSATVTYTCTADTTLDALITATLASAVGNYRFVAFVEITETVI